MALLSKIKEEVEPFEIVVTVKHFKRVRGVKKQISCKLSGPTWLQQYQDFMDFIYGDEDDLKQYTDLSDMAEDDNGECDYTIWYDANPDLPTDDASNNYYHDFVSYNDGVPPETGYSDFDHLIYDSPSMIPLEFDTVMDQYERLFDEIDESLYTDFYNDFCDGRPVQEETPETFTSSEANSVNHSNLEDCPPVDGHSLS